VLFIPQNTFTFWGPEQMRLIKVLSENRAKNIISWHA